MRATRISLALLLTAAATLAAAAAGGAAVEPAVVGPGELRPREHVPGEVLVQRVGEERERVVELPPGIGVREGVRRLREREGVRWAGPNAIARAAVIPRDPGRAGVRRGWQRDQWNFLAPPKIGSPCTESGPCGVNAPRAWGLLRAAGHPEGRRRNGERGAVVAVVDTGVAYRDKGDRFDKSPDFARSAFVRPKDFVSRGGKALDRNGHGTHVAATIIEQTGNRTAVTGLGDGLRVMPVRVLGAGGSGSARNVAKGIRYAARRGADVINLSLEFGSGFGGCGGLRGVCRAVRKAQRAGVLVVAATGNDAADGSQMPGKVSMAVAAATIRGCLSEFSSRGEDTDITAPGGGRDAPGAGSHCDRSAPGPGVVQLTLRLGAAASGDFTKFGYPRFEGTSMSTPHVSAAAALVLSSKVLQRKLGRRPDPAQLERWLECTSRPVSDPTRADLYGAGLLDLAAALDPKSACAGIG